MNDIIIQAYSNRKLSRKAVDIGNMQENEVTKLIFEFDDGITALGGNAYLVVSYDDESYSYPLQDNTFTIGRELTQRKKTAANIVISTSSDETNPLNGAVWISDTLSLLVDKNSINIDSINEQELPPSLKIIYDDLLNLQKDLQEKKDNDYWKGDKGDKGDKGERGPMGPQGIPGANGDNGEDGKSAYQYAREGGFKGTEEEFIKLLAEGKEVDLSGCVKKPTTGDGVLYFDSALNQSIVKITDGTKANAYQIPRYAKEGVLPVGTPTEETHATDKKYVDDLFAVLETYKANSIISKSSGTTVEITDAVKAKPKNIRLYGKTEQPSTEGNQLFDISLVTTSRYGTVTNNGDGTLTVKGMAVADADDHTLRELAPKLSVGDVATINAVTDGSKTIYLYGVNTNWNFGSSKTITEDMLNSVVMFYGKRENDVEVAATISEIMINLGTTTLPCEPYTGGASPNMNYKQPINHIGESGSIVGKVLGKNIWDAEYASDANNWYINLNDANRGYKEMALFVGKGKTVTLSYGQTLAAGINMYCGVVTDPTKSISDNSWLYHSAGGAYIHKTITITTIDDYIYLRDIGPLETFMQYIGNDLQIEYGDTATHCESHRTEQPFTALTPNGLPGIPLGATIPDAIKNSPIHMAGVYWDNTEGKYYISDTKDYESGKNVQRIVEYVVDGDAEWYSYPTYNGFALRLLPFKSLYRNGFCNQATINTNGLIKQGEPQLIIGQDNVAIYLIFNQFYDEALADKGLSNLKAHLNENPLVITTWLDEPIVTDLTQAELDQYNALLMNYPNTTVVNDAGAYMEVEYVADTQEHIKQNYVAKTEYNALASRVSDIEQVIANL